MAINHIVIVGGGTAGWMAAAALSKLRAGRSVAITVVESEQIGTVGVGEATIPPFLDFNRLLDIDEREMLAEVGGSFKLGIQFVNWGRLGDSYIHPFGNYGYQMEGISFHHVWHRYQQAGDKRPIQVFNMETMAAHFGRFARTEDYQRDDLPPVNYAYHLDAGRYARYLRKYAETRGVVRTEGKVIDVAVDGESGFVTGITLEDSTGRITCHATAPWRCRVSVKTAADRCLIPEQPRTKRAGNGKCRCSTATAMATSIAAALWKIRKRSTFCSAISPASRAQNRITCVL
jgi:tryptophan halogenase